MKIRTLGRHIREGTKNLGRNGGMTFSSISAVTITLFILGVFLILALNVNHISQMVEDQVEIRVFLELAASEDDAQRVENELKSISKVSSVVFLSKDEALDEFIERSGSDADLFAGLKEENPLSHVFIVKAVEPQDTEWVAQKIKNINQVRKVNYGKEIIEKLFIVTDSIRNIGLVFIVGLAFTAMFLIANTIKLTIVARRHEIQIMKLVGATNTFIRWPFFIEGLWMGILGSLIPIGLLWVGYYYLLDLVQHDLMIFFIELLPLYPLFYQIAIILLGIGTFIGIWGSMVSVRRFLKV